MVLGLTVPAFAAEDDFVIQDGVLTKYNGSGGNVVIPDGVTKISSIAFIDRLDVITSVTIPDSVTNIGEYAFQDCTGLTSVTIPGSYTETYAREKGYQYVTDQSPLITQPSVQTVLVDGKPVEFAMYALGFNVGWAADTGIFVETDKPYDPAN